MNPTFDRCNLDELSWTSVVAHGGEGQIRFHRIADEAATSGACHFIDLAELPPGASIGRHAHAEHEEEFYLVLSGSGDMLMAIRFRCARGTWCAIVRAVPTDS